MADYSTFLGEHAEAPKLVKDQTTGEEFYAMWGYVKIITAKGGVLFRSLYGEDWIPMAAIENKLEARLAMTEERIANLLIARWIAEKKEMI